MMQTRYLPCLLLSLFCISPAKADPLKVLNAIVTPQEEPLVREVQAFFSLFSEEEQRYAVKRFLELRRRSGVTSSTDWQIEGMLGRRIADLSTMARQGELSPRGRSAATDPYRTSDDNLPINTTSEELRKEARRTLISLACYRFASVFPEHPARMSTHAQVNLMKETARSLLHYREVIESRVDPSLTGMCAARLKASHYRSPR